MKIIVYDLDGTLRDTSCAAVCVPKDKTKQDKWNEWQMYVNNHGTPIQKNVGLYESDLENSCHDIFILTSSSFGTASWLSTNNIMLPDRIIEREEGDNRHPFLYKRNWLNANAHNVVKWVDDSEEMCDYVSVAYPYIEVVYVGEPKQIELDLGDTPKESVLDVQHGGSHYKGKLQPWEIINACNLNYYEGNVLKYLLRHRDKNKAEDLKKAIHYLQAMLEFEYNTIKE